MLEKDLVELLRHEIEEVLEVHQVEIDRRFDRLTARIADLDLAASALVKAELELDRKIAESELALRKYFRGMFENLQQGIDQQNVLLRQMQEIMDSLGGTVIDLAKGIGVEELRRELRNGGVL